jgi:hypothetical protein
LVEELADPVRVEGVLRLVHAEFFEDLEVAGWPLGIGVKWGSRTSAQLLVIIHILHLLDDYCIYPSSMIAYRHHTGQVFSHAQKFSAKRPKSPHCKAVWELQPWRRFAFFILSSRRH